MTSSGGRRNRGRPRRRLVFRVVLEVDGMTVTRGVERPRFLARERDLRDLARRLVARVRLPCARVYMITFAKLCNHNKYFSILLFFFVFFEKKKFPLATALFVFFS